MVRGEDLFSGVNACWHQVEQHIDDSSTIKALLFWLTKLKIYFSMLYLLQLPELKLAKILTVHFKKTKSQLKYQISL